MRVNKKDDLNFRTACILSVLNENGFAINENLKKGNYKIDGVDNSLELMFLPNQNSACFSVYCRFDKCNDLSGYMNSKHNFHSTSKMDIAIKEFNVFLNEAIKTLTLKVL